MDAHVAFANVLASQWAGVVWPAVWQSTVFAALILILTLTLKRAPASLRYWLWMLVPLRLLVMPVLSISIPVLPATQVQTVEPVESYSYSSLNDAPEPARMESDASLPLSTPAAVSAPEPLWSPIAWRTYALLGWVVGVFLLALRMARGWRWMRGLVGAAETITDGPVVEAAFQAAAMIGVRRLPRIVVTDAPVSPFACGIRRPVVVLPRRLVDHADAPGLLAVLAHEFAHLRRRDPLFGIVLGVCDTLYFFHPVVRWVRQQILLQREKACDDLVLALSKAKPSAYAKAICSAAELTRHTRPAAGPPALVAESFSDLQSRLKALASGVTPCAKLSWRSVAMLVALGVLCVPGIVLTGASSPAQAQGVAGSYGGFALPSQQSAARVLHFPADRALGAVYVSTGPLPMRFKLGPNYDAVEPWEFVSAAQGDVPVPAGKDVKLSITGTALQQDLSPLLNLAPDDIQTLSIYNHEEQPVPVDQRVMPYIRNLTGLKELEVTSPELTDWGMQYVSGLTSLRHLHVGGLRVTASGIKNVENLQSLETLYAWTSITDEALASIGNLPKLRELSINVTYIQGPGLEYLAKIPGLQYLHLQGENFGDDGLRYLARLPMLKSLRLHGEGLRITDAGMRYVAQIAGLEELELVRLAGITDAGIAELKPLQSLKLLQLHWARTTDAALATLSEMQSIEDLMLSNNQQSILTDEGLGYLSRLRNLKRLWTMGTSQTPITDTGLQYLSTMSTLEDLNFAGGAGLTDFGIGQISRLPNLKKLGILSDSRQITDLSLAHIAGVSQLKSLYVTCPQTEFSVSGVNQLNVLSQLEFLRITDVRHDDAVLNLSRLSRLRECSVTLVPYRNEDLQCFAGLSSLRRLQSICGITDEGLAYLAGLTKLQTLNIYKSSLTDEGLRHVSRMHDLHFLGISGSFNGSGLRYLTELGALQTLDVTNDLELSGQEAEFAEQAVAELRAKLPSLMFVNGKNSVRRGYGG